MGQINIEHLSKCIETLEKSYELLLASEKNSLNYEIFRNSTVKSFEMTLEQSGKLLRKKLAPYFATKKAVDVLNFKDLFRYSLKHSLLTEEEVERWFKYRDNRNDTAHDYGQRFADETLVLLESFIKDAYRLKEVIAND